MENLPPDEVLRNLKTKAANKIKWQKVHYARYTMFVISAFCLLTAIVTWNSSFESDQMVIVYITLVLAGIFIGLALWAKKQPKFAILLAISVFTFPFLFAAIEDQSTILQGFWWKFIILGLFIRGLLSVKHISTKQTSEDLIDDFEL